jgi:hypothetical protein
MSISSIFEVPDHLSSRQINWLSMCASVPSAKTVFGDKVRSEDVLLAEEAKNILVSRAKKTDQLNDTP